MNSSKPSLLRGLAVGATAGIIATVIMGGFQSLSASGEKALEKRRKLAEGESPWDIAHEQIQQEQEAASQEGSTEIVARQVAESTGHHLSPDEKKQGGNIVHYSFGTLTGIAYSVAAEFFPVVRMGLGSAFGTILFLGADELAVPALRLAPPPTETAPKAPFEHWIAHVVYGGALEISRSLLRRAL